MAGDQIRKTRICIIGAGPGGAVTSLYLSRFGIPHLVVDKAQFPRDKVCGESFDGRVHRILDDLSLLNTSGEHVQDLLLQTRSYRFQSRRLDLAMTFPNTELPRLSAQRLELDDHLFRCMSDSQYAEVLTNCPIKRIEKQSTGYSLYGPSVRIDADLVIMAAGAPATTQVHPLFYVFSRQYYEDLEPPVALGLEVFYFQQPIAGCLFLCPLSKGRYNVELGVQQSAYRSGAWTMEALQEAYLSSRPELQERFKVARPIGKRKGTSMLLRTQSRWTAPDMIYVGNGAFCVNPITGLGVGNAMSMGKLAGETIRDYWEATDFSRKVTQHYRKAASAKYRNVLLMNRTVNLMMRHFTLLEPILAPLLNTPLVRQLLLRNDLVKEFGRWKFYRKLSRSRSR